ncbi:MAG TPA: hypothetical protein VJU78_15955, partial [Chitinophagaceae bacterium]|nr:hypothetical protein [Chitinophagaceae bacterium]
WFEMYYHSGAQTAFSWAFQSGSGFSEIGTVKQDGAILKFEGRLSRSKIKGLTGTAFKIGVALTKNDWSAIIGAAPDQATTVFFVDMTE